MWVAQINGINFSNVPNGMRHMKMFFAIFVSHIIMQRSYINLKIVKLFMDAGTVWNCDGILNM